jgi:hypothetical protein
VKGVSGLVGPDGQSIVPGGLYDMAELAQDLTLDPHVEQKLEEIFQSLQDSSPGNITATYKLELALTEKRSAHRPYAGLISAWSNGGFAHGGGDEVVYFCPSKVEGPDGSTKTCGGALDLKWISKTVVLCPKCRQATKPKLLTGQIFARLPTQHWATLLLRCFEALEFSADIRIGALKGDLREAAQQEQEHEHRGDKLQYVRTERIWAIYPLANIIKDTGAGADLYGRIRAFLAA